MATTQYRGYQRCSRIDYADGTNAFLATVCVKPRRPIFTTEDVNRQMIAEMMCLQSEGFWGVYIYCIMPDHVHLIVNPGPSGLSEAIRRFKGRMAVWWRKNGDGQSLWQGGYFDHQIRHAEGFQEKCEYVLQNPVRAGLIARPEDYPWCGSLAHRT